MILTSLVSGMLILASSQEIARKVDFEARAARVENLLPELSKSTGTSFMFSPQTKDEVLVIKVTDVPLNQLMEKIAAAAAAEWQKEGEGYRLIRSPKLLRKLEEESTAYELKLIETSRTLLRKSLDSVPQYTDAVARAVAEQLVQYASQQPDDAREMPDFRRAESMRPSLPSYRLAMRIALSIDPKVLAKLPLNRRVAFSNQPNRLQIALPPNTHQFFAEYRESVRKLAGHLPAEPKLPSGGLESNVWYALNLGKRAGEDPAKVLMKTTRTSSTGYFSFEFLVTSEAGRILDRAYMNMYPRDPMAIRNPPPADAQADAAEKPVEFAPLTKEYFKFVGYDPAQTARPPMSAALIQILLNPEKHEPGALGYSDLLFSLSMQKDLDVVAAQGPEYIYHTVVGGNENTMKPSAWLRRLESAWSSSVRPDREGSWLLLRPTDWFRKRDFIHDRAALGRFIRSAHRQPPSIDDMAAFAVQSKSREAFDVAQALVRIVSADRKDESGYFDFDLLQLHGSLSPMQRQHGLSDRGLLFSGLTPAQQAHLQNCLLANQGFYGHVEIDYRNGPPPEEDISPYDSIKNDPFEAYGNGIPGSGSLKVTFKNSPIIRAAEMRGAQTHSYTEFEPSGLAYFLMSLESDRRSSYPDYGSFTAVEQEKYEYKFTAVAPLVHNGQLARNRGLSETVDSIDKLPKHILDPVLAEVKKIKDARGGVRPPASGGGG